MRFSSEAKPAVSHTTCSWLFTCTWTAEPGEQWLTVDTLRVAETIMTSNHGAVIGTPHDHAYNLVNGIAYLPLPMSPSFDFENGTSVTWHLDDDHRDVLGRASLRHKRAEHTAARTNPPTTTQPWFLVNGAPLRALGRERPREIVVGVRADVLPELTIRFCAYANSDGIERLIAERSSSMMNMAFAR